MGHIKALLGTLALGAMICFPPLAIVVVVLLGLTRLLKGEVR
jgi:hypothetical protein